MIRKFLKKWGISVCAVIAGLIAILICLALFEKNIERHIKEDMQSYTEEIRDNGIFSLNNELNYFIKILEAEARTFNVLGSLSDETILTELRDFQGNSKNMARAILMTYGGKVYTSFNEIHEIEITPHLKNMNREKTFISQPTKSKWNGRSLINIITPLYSSNKKIGVLISSYDLKEFESMFLKKFLKGDCAINLATETGYMIARSGSRPPPLAFKENIFDFYNREDVLFLSGSPQELKEHMNQARSGWMSYKHQGKTRYVAYAPTGINDWYIAAVSTDQTLNTHASEMNKVAIYLILQILTIMILLVFVIVIARRKEARRLLDLKNCYSIALKKSNDLFYEADIAEDRYIDHSENRDEKIWGKLPDKYSNALKQVAEICAPEHRQEFLDMFLPQNIKIKIEEGISSIHFEYKIMPDEKTSRWLSATLVPIIGEEKDCLKLICMEKDITEQKVKQEKLKNSASIDGLTGLYNKIMTKRYIDDYLNNQGMDGQHALFMIDIDFFKGINDNLGHLKGDEVLTEFGLALQRIFYQSDIVGRVGGDEFIAFLKNYSNLELLQSKAVEVQDAFRKTHFLEADGSVRCATSASIGIAIYTQDGKNFDELYHHADIALYLSKKQGKDRYTFFQDQ